MGAGRLSDRDRPATARVAALIPCHAAPPEPRLVERVRTWVGGVLLVDDGTPPVQAAELECLAEEICATLVRLPENRGKGTAIAAGLRHLRASAEPPEAVLLVDADGQHPSDAIPAFLAAAAHADLVLGDRLGDARSMPWTRRAANRIATRLLAWRTRRPVRDSQCGMRLLRGRALWEIDFPHGRYESETVHLKRCLLAGVSVAWVPIPAIYDGEESSFRPLRDLLRVLAALLR